MNYDLCTTLPSPTGQKETLELETTSLFHQMAGALKNQVLHIMQFNPDRVSYLSPSFEPIWGRSVESVLQSFDVFFNSIHPDDRAMVSASVKRQSQGLPTADTYRIIRPNGEIRWIQDWASPIFTSNGELAYVMGLAEDITDRKTAEIVQRQLLNSLESVNGGFISIDSNDRVVFLNSLTEGLLNIRRDDAIGRHLVDVLSSTEQRRVLHRYQQHKRSNEPLSFLETIDGKILQVFFYPTPGSGVSIFLNNMTELHILQKASKEREELFHNVFSALREGIVIQSAESLKIVECNQFAADILGLTYDQLMGRDSFDPKWKAVRADGTDLPGDEHPSMISLSTGLPVTDFMMGVHLPNGKLRWINVNTHPLVRQGEDKPYAVVVTFIDVTQSREEAAALKRTEEQFRVLAESLPQFIWTADANGNINYVSENFLKLNSIKDDQEILGDAWISYVHPDDRERTTKAWMTSVAGLAPYNIEFRLQSGNKGYRWYLTRAAALRDERGRILKWVGYSADIHDQKVDTERLNQAKQEAERANRLKSAFLANMSHEIRTPLGIMLGFIDLLIDTNATDSERNSYSQTVKRNGEILTTLINDILDLSKVEAGYLQVESVQFSIRTLIQEVLASLQIAAAERHLRLDLEIADNVSSSMSSDPIRLRQILSNVIGNAIKFTEDGGIRIVITQKDHMLNVEVSDTGVGIPKEAHQAVFEPFTQADQSITRRFGGTGLGLTLSRRLARLLGGDLQLIRSEKGMGSTFLISVNVGRTIGSRLTSVPTPLKADVKMGELNGLRVLLVEDSPDNQLLLRHVLERRGASVEIANNGREALAKASTTSHDVILMDVEMPIMDGYTATSELRARGFENPIIAVSAHAMSESRDKCMEAGCSGYVTKPVRFAELINVIQTLQRSHHMH